MKKIQSLFKRDYVGNRQVYDEIVEGSEWVIDGYGIATEKFDGTSCLIKDGKLYKRYDRKLTKSANKRKKKHPELPLSIADFKQAPTGWLAILSEVPNLHTGHFPGWVLIDHTLPENRWHSLGWEWLCEMHFPYGSVLSSLLKNGTYELVGMGIQSNPYKLDDTQLWRHGLTRLESVPVTFEGLKSYLRINAIEGVVWHHGDDSRMVKIKARDFGIEWPR